MLIPDIFKKFSIRPVGIVHIGAHQCEEYSIYKDDGKCDNILWIEANPELVDMNKQFDIYQAVISDTTGTDVEFIVTNNIQSSSFLELKDHLIEHPDVHEQKRIRLTTTTFVDFVRTWNIDCASYDFLAMDIQGAELHALRGMGNLISNFKYIYLEVNTKELYKGCGLLPDVTDFLKLHGFELVDIVMMQHGWGDAFFIRQSPHMNLMI